MKQKADKEIEKMEAEETKFARIFRVWKTAIHQREKKGKWK